MPSKIRPTWLTPLRIALLPLVLGATGCGCTLIGCFSGLQVELTRPPAPPFRVEAVARDGTRFVSECNNGVVTDGCGGASFLNYFPPNVTIEVISGGDTTRHEFKNIRYDKFAPNGERCGPGCTLARLTVP